MKTLSLGHCDAGKYPADRKEYLRKYHNAGGVIADRVSFIYDDLSTIRYFKKLSDNQVTQLQQFLFSAGFMPKCEFTGVFGYATHASLRLFQEYVRTIEGYKEVMPDGIAGKITYQHIARWQDQNLQSRWNNAGSPSHDYIDWLKTLEDAKAHYLVTPNKVLDQVKAFGAASDTLTVSDWNFDPGQVHLIGLRSNEDATDTWRQNDDLFVLLINGLTFYFWGSTDPRQGGRTRRDEPFIVEGQHKYRFAWHGLSSQYKVYRALRTYSHGVLVFRDRNDDNSLTLFDIEQGLDGPNNTINIHWSGIGTSNYSAGCQVIAGASYINDRNFVIDCTSFAAANSSELSYEHRKTKAAYNVFADLVLTYAPRDVDFLYYTLGRDDTLDLLGSRPNDFVSLQINRMKKVV